MKAPIIWGSDFSLSLDLPTTLSWNLMVLILSIPTGGLYTVLGSLFGLHEEVRTFFLLGAWRTEYLVVPTIWLRVVGGCWKSSQEKVFMDRCDTRVPWLISRLELIFKWGYDGIFMHI